MLAEKEMDITGIKIQKQFSYKNYPNDLAVVKMLRTMGELSFHKSVTFFVGENGTGKPTLIEALAVNFGFNPEVDTRHYNFSTK